MTERIRLKLSVQHALLGNIPSSIYCVSASIINKHIELYFYTDNPISEEMQEDISCIGTEVIADFEEGYTIGENIIYCKKNEFKMIGDIAIFRQKFL